MGCFGTRNVIQAIIRETNKMTNLLTSEERKALIEKLVTYDSALYFSIALDEKRPTGKIKKHIRKVYNKLSDAQLMSFKFEEEKKK
jgi:hypothetical protein